MTNDAEWLAKHNRTARLRHRLPKEPAAAVVLVTAIRAGIWRKFIRRPTGTALEFLDMPSHANDNDCAAILAETSLKPVYRRQLPW